MPGPRVVVSLGGWRRIPVARLLRARALLPSTPASFVLQRRMDVAPDEANHADLGSPGSRVLDRAIGVLRSAGGRRVARVEVELLTWSGTKSQLVLRPRQRHWPPMRGRRENRYFSIARAVLERVSGDIVDFAGALSAPG